MGGGLGEGKKDRPLRLGEDVSDMTETAASPRSHLG